MLLRGHCGNLIRLNLGRGDPEHVRAFDDRVDSTLGDDVEDTGLCEQRHVAIDAPGRDVAHFGGQLRSGERVVTEERLDDAEPHRM